MKKTLLSITSKLTYINHKIYEENLTAIHGKKYAYLLTNLHMLDLQYYK